MDKTIVISLLFFFLLLYIEWNNINSSNISFMFDHRFIPHHKFSVTSLFQFQPNVKNKNTSLDFDYCMTAMKGNDRGEKKKREKRVSKQKGMTSCFGFDEVLAAECVVQTWCLGRKMLEYFLWYGLAQELPAVRP